MRLALAIGVCVFLAGAYYARAEPAPLLKVGQTYALVMDCDKAIGCYIEVHRIKAIGSDGWLETEQCEEETCHKVSSWRVNLARVLAIQPYRIGKAAN